MWITLTPAGILSRLTAREVEAMRTAAAQPGQADPLPDILAQVTREVRGHVAACPDNRLGPEGTIPDELTGAAIDRVRFDLATRLPVASLLTDARQEANRNALALLRAAASCHFRIVNPPAGDEGEQPLPPATGHWGSAPKLNFD